MTLYKIRVYPDGIEGLVEAETSLLDALERLGVRLETLCGGAGWCGQCLVKAKGHLSEISPVETDLISEDKLKEGYRLACQTYIKGDVDVEIPPQTRTYAHRILTTGIKMEDFKINPAVKSYNINLSPPSLDDQRSDLD
ncbi:MAG TPA: 2Fe-2S iron-sulfur cluster-binding protein, partial [bacterium]|nr:2Fe-2S iron-sulfur cluster-binding protein [bacterium]